MSRMDAGSEEPGEIEALLPWYATGRLSAGETARVEAALAADPGLAAHLERIAEEREAAIASAEAMPALNREREAELLAAFARKPPLAKTEPPAGWIKALGAWIAGLRAPTLGYGALAAALVLLVVGGTIGGLVGGRSGGDYQTASGPEAPAGEGAFVLVAFQPGASAADIEALLVALPASIVDGPRAGGLYRLRIGPAGMSEAERQAASDRLTGATGVVKLVIASP